MPKSCLKRSGTDFMSGEQHPDLVAAWQAAYRLPTKPVTSLASPKDARSANEAALFHEEAAYWQIAYSGDVFVIAARKGLVYLQYLLLRPEEKVHVRDLDVLADTRYISAELRKNESEARSGRLADRRHPSSDSGDIVDARAAREYRARLRELTIELDEASCAGDIGRAHAIGNERDYIANQLSAAFGRNRRARKLDDPIEKVRKAVSNRIHDSIGKIATQNSMLGRHLVNSIRTGFYCVYSPEHNVTWKP
jgi:hypothetical protein